MSMVVVVCDCVCVCVFVVTSIIVTYSFFLWWGLLSSSVLSLTVHPG